MSWNNFEMHKNIVWKCLDPNLSYFLTEIVNAEWK